ncbi:tRNA (adenine(58)-N(1))-methyltransferase catalytic subunit TRM61 [Psilocybe cubensis]|uniref:tRNA (adenine(58)-N(1))-methyltransferase catalytic subunit TRM61 n=2 Tax=Psilocybe cubensis TaxID=181762 RepID=A0A8H7XQI7_PSICU|nr:tRNA (adenine(58)-N(1))-methyltransferase catalytic subunit TRM61 [Psilocybe cubensis]KAH9480720.1 tRNA (adenine(58)-N(1))-methyltransferase catalytic subunit TRM61 [Psilocybe cubensis]
MWSSARHVAAGDTVIVWLVRPSPPSLPSLSHPLTLPLPPQTRDNIQPLTITPGRDFNTKFGNFKQDHFIGVPYGSKVPSRSGRGFVHILRPTPELWTVALPHRTQILYVADIAFVTAYLGIRPGSRVVEAGTGSASFSHSVARTIGAKGHLYSYEFHEARYIKAKEEFARHGLESTITLTHRNVCKDGFTVVDAVDAVFLDLPAPWDAVEHAKKALRKDTLARICCFSPCIEQVLRTVSALNEAGFTEITTYETLLRPHEVFQHAPLQSVAAVSERLKASEVRREEKRVRQVEANRVARGGGGGRGVGVKREREDGEEEGVSKKVRIEGAGGGGSGGEGGGEGTGEGTDVGVEGDEDADAEGDVDEDVRGDEDVEMSTPMSVTPTPTPAPIPIPTTGLSSSTSAPTEAAASSTSIAVASVPTSSTTISGSTVQTPTPTSTQTQTQTQTPTQTPAQKQIPTPTQSQSQSQSQNQIQNKTQPQKQTQPPTQKQTPRKINVAKALHEVRGHTSYLTFACLVPSVFNVGSSSSGSGSSSGVFDLGLKEEEGEGVREGEGEGGEGEGEGEGVNGRQSGDKSEVETRETEVEVKTRESEVETENRS